METVAWIGFAVALFSGFLIAAKINRNTSDKLLSALLILMAVEFATFVADRMAFGDRYLLSNPFFLFNPAIYLYILSLTRQEFRLKWTQLLHLLPYVVFESTAYLIREAGSIRDFLERDATLWFRTAFAVCSFISWVVYSLLSILKVHRHRMNLMHEFSTLDSYKMITWLLFLLVFYIVMWMGSIAMGLANYFTGKEDLIPVFTYSVLLLLTFILGFYGLKQQTIFARNQVQNGAEKYIKSRLKPEDKQKIRTRILECFEKQKPYLDSELTIVRLADMLKTSRHVLTEVINTEFGRNFYQFVNEYRVEAVKQKLSDPKLRHLSIEAIGYDCGFNSKSTFFSVFKAVAGCTPLQFRKDSE